MSSSESLGDRRRWFRLLAWDIGFAVAISLVASILPWLAPKIPLGAARRAMILFLKG